LGAVFIPFSGFGLGTTLDVLTNRPGRQLEASNQPAGASASLAVAAARLLSIQRLLKAHDPIVTEACRLSIASR